jgi:hypothetical protein
MADHGRPGIQPASTSTRIRSEANTTMSSSRTHKAARLGLRAGDWVSVKSRPEILATLDGQGRLDGLPFQPEMWAFCGQRLRVRKVAHKTCDTIHKTGGRRMYDTVHLEGAQCDGSAHGGCQADCNFFWKEAWLRRADDRPRETLGPSEPRCREEDVMRAVHAPGQAPGDDPTWSCQTTALFEATEPLPWWDARQYLRDVTSGNHSAWHMAMLLLMAGYQQLLRSVPIGYRVVLGLYNVLQKVRGSRPMPMAYGQIPDGKPTPTEALDLRPGELVEVKSVEAINTTITHNGFNRGMRYDVEMAKYSGGRYRVQMRVDRLINERTGKMMQMKGPCIQLEDVYCRAECTPRRLGCPRAMNTYWREIWLRRVNPD